MSWEPRSSHHHLKPEPPARPSVPFRIRANDAIDPSLSTWCFCSEINSQAAYLHHGLLLGHRDHHLPDHRSHHGHHRVRRRDHRAQRPFCLGERVRRCISDAGCAISTTMRDWLRCSAQLAMLSIQGVGVLYEFSELEAFSKNFLAPYFLEAGARTFNVAASTL